MDAEYILQTVYLENCMEKLSPMWVHTLNELKTSVIQDAVERVKSVLETVDHAIFDQRGFIKCIEILALHKANTMLCAEFESMYPDYDLIKKYALLEYAECIKQKNAPHIKSIDFSIPIVFKENFGLDMTQMRRK